jgi:hypothetical protein
MARSSVAQFAAQLRAFSKKVEKRYRRVVGELAKRLHRKIVRRTPIGEDGSTRASWNLSVDAPDFRTVELGGVTRLSGSEATQVAMETQGSLKGFTRPFHQRLYIANGNRHVSLLEHGSSKKAPRGMVLVSIAEVIAEGPRPLDKGEEAA